MPTIIPKVSFISPILAVALALALVAFDEGVGLDGAAKATAMLFWFLPVILVLGYVYFLSLRELPISKPVKIFVSSIWLIPSMPLGLASFYGIMLISESGFKILF